MSVLKISLIFLKISVDNLYNMIYNLLIKQRAIAQIKIGKVKMVDDMLKSVDILKNVEEAVFEAITTACCMEEDGLGNVTYYLHGDEETGDLYENSGEHNPDNVLFTAEYRGELDDDEDGSFDFESKDNPDFMDVVTDLADQWIEAYGK